MRNIHDVIAKIKSVVPESETEIHERLDYWNNSASFKAPELMSDCWAGLMCDLGSLIGAPSEPWQLKVSDIMTNKETPGAE